MYKIQGYFCLFRSRVSRDNRRRKYIFSLFKKFGDDAEALTTHYMQFVQDNQVMKKMYVKEMEQLIWETGLYFF